MPDELEPLELEPIDLEPAGDLPRSERERGPARSRRRTWAGLALVGIGLVSWAAIASTTRDERANPVPPPVTPTTTTTAPVDRVATVAPALRAGLRGIGSGRFAAVIDDRLYLLDATRAAPTLVRLPEGHATIEERSGSSLLTSTFEQTLVATRPIATRTLSPRDSAIPALEPGRWWLVRNDGTVRDDRGGPPVLVPAALRIVAAVPDGFVGINAPDFTWAVWSGGSAPRTIAAAGFQLLARGAHTLVFKYDCVYTGCGLEILDLRDGSARNMRLSIVPEFAEYSPDGTRLALASTLGDVYILDARSGGVVARTTALTSPSASSPLAWTPDGALLIVHPDTLVIWRGASDGLTTKAIGGTAGLEQIVALP